MDRTGEADNRVDREVILGGLAGHEAAQRSSGARHEVRRSRRESAIRRSSEARASGPDRGTNPATTEKLYTAEEVEFLAAVAAYKKRVGRHYLANTEILAVVKSLGYSRP